jgi:hypothetical protein
MRRTALAAEWRHGWSLEPPPAFVETMRRVYLRLGPETCRELVGIGRIAIRGAGFQLHDDGDWAFLTPILQVRGDVWQLLVWDCLFPPEDVWRVNAEIIDIVAWHPATPGRWATRTGYADMLGTVQPPLWEDGPTRVHQTPYGWLKSGGEGICFLTTDRPMIAFELRSAGRIVADAEAHARELRQICAHPYPIPRIIAA